MSAFDTLPSAEKLAQVAEALNEHGFKTEVVANSEEAKKRILALLPNDAEVMTGSSQTLQQIGFLDELQNGAHQWKNLNGEIWSENDEEKRGDLRRKANAAEYFLSSVNAVTEDGLLVAVDATGSRVGSIPFAAKNIIFVIGAQKITTNLETAMQRIREYVFPKEDARALEAYGVHSTFGKWVILEREVNPTRITVLLVNESLGY